MNTLRLRIAALIVCAIVAVVGMATSVAIAVIGRPGPERMVQDAALQIDLISRLAEQLPDDFEPGMVNPNLHGMRLLAGPASGTVDERLTEVLRSELARIGQPRPVLVSQPVPNQPMTVSVPIASQGWWIAMPLSARPPPPRTAWFILLGWMSAIILGAAGIAVVISNRLTRPLQMIEGAIASVGPDGTLPVLPELGSGEMKATAKALNRLSARLKSAMESRMRLVAAAGHDLRTPMTRMRLRAEFVGDDDERALWLRDLEELDRIADSAIRLVREEASSGARERVEITGLLREITGELTIQGMRLELGQTVEAEVGVARLALTRALRNLFINAATHGGGGRIEGEIDGAFAVVFVRDNGPGIPDDLIAHVFEPFFRVDPSRRQAMPGAGLGLAIAREIIERNGGSITVSNGVVCGLVQEIRLPLAQDRPPA
ncbi:two-component sensor histidine kinase [Mesorhizobium sp. BR1-1-16]|uniref:ATP-binding protein n=1 Tax=Mesorhizobium sp. BR1-1-16 TaxID=2876653 RepID=UPI001CCDE29F|nr:ATP-binding protein [Mesorhizobium sp. BR1-1-16]MBZ9936320.1 two-component sensor histidine kinase [Mesorhizobium sp. BR1-1-16]